MVKRLLRIIPALFAMTVLFSGVAQATVTAALDSDTPLVTSYKVTWLPAVGFSAVPYANIDLPTEGYIFKVVTNPGSPAPDDNYDLQLLNANGTDLFNGQLVNRDTANIEEVYLKTPGATDAWGGVYFDGHTATFSVYGVGNLDNTGETFIYFLKKKP